MLSQVRYKCGGNYSGSCFRAEIVLIKQEGKLEGIKEEHDFRCNKVQGMEMYKGRTRERQRDGI